MKGLTDAPAHELAHDGKVIVHIDGGLHATEVAGAQHTIALAYNLVTATDPATTAILDNVILVLWSRSTRTGRTRSPNGIARTSARPTRCPRCPTSTRNTSGTTTTATAI